MSKIIFFFISLVLVAGCSFNENSKFWTKSQNILVEDDPNYEEIFVEEETLSKELNANITLNLGNDLNNNIETRNYFNNDGRLNYDGDLKKSSRYKFSKIDDFYQFEPEILFDDKNIIFFGNKGSIYKFNDKSKLIWQKNYYSKSEKKTKPVLQFANNKSTLIVADNVAKLYAINLFNGDLL